MNIKQSILLCALISISNLNAMLHKLTGHISKQHAKNQTQKILKRMQHQCAEKKSRSNTILMTALAVPAGMVGSGIGMCWGALASFTTQVVDENGIKNYLCIGAAIGASTGGLGASYIVGGIPGTTAWTISIIALSAPKVFDKYQKNNRHNN